MNNTLDLTQNKTLIQIILKRPINKYGWFLDEKQNDPKYNYHVTTNTRPWNEFIKKGLDFIEFRRYKSPRRLGKLMWSKSPFLCSRPEHKNADKSQTTNTNQLHQNQESNSKLDTVTFIDDEFNNLIVQVVNDEPVHVIKSQEDIISEQALQLAKNDIKAAMAHMEKYLPNLFTSNFQRCVHIQISPSLKERPFHATS
ncbi:unnamed protein product [Rotaria sp. Silwood2]|nr:unnamed protein product [Rotaria sp. Silwood2]